MPAPRLRPPPSTASSSLSPPTKLTVLAQEIAREQATQTLESPKLRDALQLLSGDITSNAVRAQNEAEVVSIFETRLYQFIHDVFHLDINFEREVKVETVRHTAKGRIDSRVGAVVIEYKHPGKLSGDADQRLATDQISNYLTSLEKQGSQGLLGLVTDGVSAQVIVVDERGVLNAGTFEPLSGKHLEHLVRGALQLEKAALTPENLVKDFCLKTGGKATVVQELTAALYSALSVSSTDRSKMLFREWQSLFRLAHDDSSKMQAIAERREALSEALGIQISPGDNDTEYRALYALQTAFAIAVKIIALKVISAVRNDPTFIKFDNLANSRKGTIRSKLDRLEAGDLFREMGIGNLLEGDFFAWYCTPGQWTDQIEAAVRRVFGVLSVYEAQPLFSDGGVAAADVIAGLSACGLCSAHTMQGLGDPEGLALDVFTEVNLYPGEGLKEPIACRRNLRQKNAL